MNFHERLQKNVRQVFSLDLSTIFPIYQLINSKEMALST